MKKSGPTEGQSASELIDKSIAELGDWRGETLSRMRKLIKEADPDVVEEWKWRKPSHPGVPVWSHQGLICTGESYKSIVKLTFAKGASVKDPAKVFNSSLDGNVRRAIDIHEGEEVDAGAFKALFVPRSPSIHPAERQGQGERSRLRICSWRYDPAYRCSGQRAICLMNRVTGVPWMSHSTRRPVMERRRRPAFIGPGD